MNVVITTIMQYLEVVFKALKSISLKPLKLLHVFESTFDVLESVFDVVWYSFKKVSTIALALLCKVSKCIRNLYHQEIVLLWDSVCLN